MRLRRLLKAFQISKYKTYLPEADSMGEAEEMAPDNAEVYEGDQGGYFYVTEAMYGEGEDEDDTEDEDLPSIEDENLEYGGYDLEETDPLEIMDNPEDWYVYMEHPQGDYIADIDSVNTESWDEHELVWGGSYNLTLEWDDESDSWVPQEGFSSTPVGMTDEVPELGPDESIQPNPTAQELEGGDIVVQEDAAGFQHFTELSDVSQDGIHALTTDGEEIAINQDVDGVVVEDEPEDPAAQYDTPDREWIEENTNIQDVEEAVNFGESLAKNVAEGTAHEMKAAGFVWYIGGIDDEDLLTDAYGQVLANDGYKSAREGLESRMRSKGLDPEEIRDRGINPEEVPEVRQNTVFSDFTSDQATDAAAVLSQNSRTKHWESWNDLLDHMTEDELFEALERTTEYSYGDNIAYDDPTHLSDKEFGRGESTSHTTNHGLAGIISRLPEGSAERVSKLADSTDNSQVAQNLREYGASFLKSAEDRRHFYENEGINHQWARVQFDESMESQDRLKEIGNIITSNTTDLNTQGLRAALWGYEGADSEDVNGYNNERPIGAIEPSEKLVEAIEHNRERLAEGFEEPALLPPHMQENLNDDGTLTVYRGVKEKITGHTSAEPWSTRKNTASNFDGQGVLRANVDPEDIIVAHGYNHDNFSSEKEVTMSGAKVASKAEVIEGELYKGEDIIPDGQFVIGNRKEVEAALFDETFDPGMFSQYRIIDGWVVDVESGEKVAQWDPSDEPTHPLSLSDEIAHSAAQRLSEKLLGKATTWDGPFEGERGGTYWVNDHGERRYQPPGEGEESTDDDEESETTTPDEGHEQREEGYYVSADPNPEEDVAKFMSDETAEELVSQTNEEPFAGFSVHRNLDTYPAEDDDVWIVGLTSVNISADEGISREDVVEFYEEYLPVLEEIPGVRIGGYHFPEDENKISIDLSAAVTDKDEAVSLGEWNRQDSIINPKLALGEDDWENGSISTYEGDDVGEPRATDPDEIVERLKELDSLAKHIRVFRRMEKSPDDEYVNEDGHVLSRRQMYHHARAGAGSIEQVDEGYMVDGVLYTPVAEEKSYWEVMEEKRRSSLEKSDGFAKVDDELMKFYTHIVWYDVEKDAEDVNLEKAPEMWRHSDEVPEFVEEYIKEAVKDDAFWQGRLSELPPGAERHVQDLFEEKMTQPQGWSLKSIVNDLKDLFNGVDEEYLMEVTRNEVAALANKARENAYDAAEKRGETFEFYWSGPEDFRTTEVCSRAKAATNPNHGGTPLTKDELKELLYRIASEEEDGNTSRADEWIFHHQCRHTFVRKVYL